MSGPNYIARKYVIEKSPIRLELNRNHCILIAYCGANYVGSQRQPWATAKNTIEEELFKAMLNNQWITDDQYWKPRKIHFERGSRTDRGVSAAMQCFSLFLSRF